MQDAVKHVCFITSATHGETYLAHCCSEPSRSALSMANSLPLIDISYETLQQEVRDYLLIGLVDQETAENEPVIRVATVLSKS